MTDYKAMYFKLFNRIAAAIELLQKAQQEVEEDYIESEEASANERQNGDE
ncbi:MAG: hypothetical protein FWE85_02415 [Clostridiales bacterium]|nr:hypothetical protein [Clostridiales bacterium]